MRTLVTINCVICERRLNVKKNLIVTVAALFCLGGCAAIGESLRVGHQASHNGVQIYKGQSVESIERALGPPNVVSSGGPLCKNATNLPFGTSPGWNAIEWVYIGPVYSTIIYTANGNVCYVHQIPTSKVRQ